MRPIACGLLLVLTACGAEIRGKATEGSPVSDAATGGRDGAGGEGAGGSGGLPAIERQACARVAVPVDPAARPRLGEPLSLFLAIDRSSSMAAGPSDPWGAVGEGVRAFLDGASVHDVSVSFGFFPDLDRACLGASRCPDFAAPADCGENGCRGGPGDGATGFLDSRLAMPALDAAFAIAPPEVSAAQPRPLECGLRAMRKGCAPEIVPDGQACVPILITNGGPTACEAQPSALSELLSSDLAAGLSPVIVALPGAAGDLPLLRSIADATVVDLTANGSAASITAALETTRVQLTKPRAVPCEWAIPTYPDGTPPSPDRVNLHYLDHELLYGVGQVGSRVACDGLYQGWYYDDPVTPTTIRGCPRTCELAKSYPMEIQLGCRTFPETLCFGDLCDRQTSEPPPPETCPEDAPTPDAGAGTPVPEALRSCAGLASDCGPASNESCCASPLVTGGNFYRGYDAVSLSPIDYTSLAYPAKVSDFRLDRFEVTVGRFRKFRAAWDAGYRPDPGAGKHLHLRRGRGLVNDTCPGRYESGWDPAWDVMVAPTDVSLSCGVGGYTTWSPSPGPNESRPIACVSWHEAAAFCAWDGGFLPSETEWNYAAAGGLEQRAYPWSNPPGSTAIDCTYANYTQCVAPPYGSTNNVGSLSPNGDGRYGQADLGGNLFEWTLDLFAPRHAVPCEDCAHLPSNRDGRVIRGGSYSSWGCPESTCGPGLLSSTRELMPETARLWTNGFRCARAP